jgi:hypothetical protein
MHNPVLNLAPFGLLFHPTTNNELILSAVGTCSSTWSPTGWSLNTAWT